jgi:hypothetical protein
MEPLPIAIPGGEGRDLARWTWNPEHLELVVPVGARRAHQRLRTREAGLGLDLLGQTRPAKRALLGLCQVLELL